MKNPFAAALAALSLLLVPGVAVAGGSEPGDDAAKLSPTAVRDQPAGVAGIAVSAAAAAAAAAATVAMGSQDSASGATYILPPHRPSSMLRRPAR